jgi:hypothetical protein
MSKIGYIDGLTGETLKMRILTETVDGRYVLKRYDGSDYYGSYLMLLAKELVKDVKDEAPVNR